jgi:hypothetical protein
MKIEHDNFYFHGLCSTVLASKRRRPQPFDFPLSRRAGLNRRPADYESDDEAG